jgi:putative membrane protein
LIINAFVLHLASGFSSGFRVVGFAAAFWGALALAVLHMIFRAMEGQK